MSLETWFIKIKKTITQALDPVYATPPTKNHVTKRSRVRVLAFEVGAIMPKLTHMWRFLSEENIVHLHNKSIYLQGVRKVISNKDGFLLGLACAEMVDNINILAKFVSRLSKRCQDSRLGCFESVFDEFANTGHDPYGWVLSTKHMEVRVNKMERYVASTAKLYKKMDVQPADNKLKKSLQKEVMNNTTKHQNILDIQQNMYFKKQEVKYLEERSLWNKSFDEVTLLLATSIFTILSRIQLVFGVTHRDPSNKTSKHEGKDEIPQSYFETYSKMLKPASNTLGYAALSLHYANLIIMIEKIISSPRLVGHDARDDLYAMLPNSIRSSLRGRLKGIGFIATDPVLAGEWREALGKILGWLSPLAHNMIKWQSERSFEHQNLMPKTNVLLLQTLFFANRLKTEAAITELLVGLNYIWRFERQMKGKALFSCIPVK